MAAVAAAGCSVGQGSPDGWRYLRAPQVAVAHPRSWRETPTGAVLLDRRGRTDAALTVGPVRTDRYGRPADAPDNVVPPHARENPLILDGHPARVFDYIRRSPDGRPAAYVEIRVPGFDGRPLVVRAWVVLGAGHNAVVLPEIVNSVSFSRGRLP
jgi:hypothetical protein